ncbi:hypothetical protein ACQKQD_24160 [Methylobacterium sp. NPDC080182]|uniref:hypothetical protein n=1 Tax=Methylobacterium sp. NPDC080182 TaxID=3390590 RepID=UPI003CFDC97D
MDTESAVAGILAANIFLVEHDALAEALAPLVAALPPLREWNEDDEWTPAECAQNTARRFVETHAHQDVKTDPWLTLENLRRRLGEMQIRHREVTAVEAIGDFYGYRAFAKAWYLDDGPGEATVSLFRRDDSVEFSAPLLTLHVGATRREAELMLTAFEAGHKRGRADGIAHIRNEFRELILADD